VFAVAFVDDTRLIAGNDRGDLRLWDTSTGTELHAQPGAHTGAVTSVAVSPDHKSVASSGVDGAVRIWSAGDLAPSASAAKQSGAVNDVAFTPAGDVVAADNDGTVRFWRVDGGERRERLVADPSGDVIRSVAVSPDGKTLAVATASIVTLFDLTTDDPLGALNGQAADPLDVAFSPDGQWFASVSGEGRVNLWDTATRLGIGPRFTYHSGAIWHAAVTRGSTVITAGKDGTVRTLDVLDFRDACTLGAGALDPGARSSYLGGTDAIACRS
jgi:WD40 repeat protein